LVAVIGLQIGWYRVRRAAWWLRDLPARFEAWVDAADAERFIQRADAITNAVLALIIALAVGACFWGLISIILEGLPR
jgi:hypothetical protein